MDMVSCRQVERLFNESKFQQMALRLITEYAENPENKLGKLAHDLANQMAAIGNSFDEREYEEARRQIQNAKLYTNSLAAVAENPKLLLEAYGVLCTMEFLANSVIKNKLCGVIPAAEGPSL